MIGIHTNLFVGQSDSPRFPGEIAATPRSWVEQAYPTLTYFNKVGKGGHFAAWEEPDLLCEEIRAAFRGLRGEGAKH